MSSQSALRATVIVLGVFLMAANAAELPPLFAPPGMWTNDNWFAESAGLYHAFYLQVPTCMGDPHTWWLDRLPDGRGGYIHKVLRGPAGNDVLITTSDAKLSLPYPVTYHPDGSVSLGLPQP